MSNEFAWECECGNIEYSNEIPEECSKCLAINSFTQLPEELIEEREKAAKEEVEEASFRQSKSSRASKPKLKKPTKPKRKSK